MEDDYLSERPQLDCLMNSLYYALVRIQLRQVSYSNKYYEVYSIVFITFRIYFYFSHARYPTWKIFFFFQKALLSVAELAQGFLRMLINLRKYAILLLGKV